MKGYKVHVGSAGPLRQTFKTYESALAAARTMATGMKKGNKVSIYHGNERIEVIPAV